MMRLPPDIKIRLVEFENRSKSLMVITVDSTAAAIILCRIILCESFIETIYVMLCRANLAVYCEKCEKRINAMCGQNAELRSFDRRGK